MESLVIWTVLRALGLVLLILLTVGGNVLVCLAVGVCRKLRCVTNGLVVSLAATDLLLGLLVLPFSAMKELRSDWPLGAVFCNVYISMDVMLCTASILNLFAISVDRYFAITAPLRYPTLVTPQRVGVAMGLIWAVALMVSFLPIHMGWNTRDLSIQNQGEDDRQEDCRFELNISYVLVDAFATFYLPLLIMCGTYYRIFRIAREQARRINARTSTACVAAAVREHKATVTLAAVLGAFIICWFPYFTYFIYLGLREETSVDPTTYPVVLWLGYANSALNPILYAALNRDFRRAYGQLLRCRGSDGPSMPPAGQMVLLCTHATCKVDFREDTGSMLQERSSSTQTSQDR
ncbi:histamine H2 receptor-like [Scleropages formosus]|uniref:histamine H2 receptor-like n=1 Tax=Scleropages formosus TaxID=113540 RepID=UPI0008782E5E|nr:histamine H2 receptor [Scleropages formosus]